MPVWGAGLGLQTGLIVILLSAMQMGSLLLQWPLGWLLGPHRPAAGHPHLCRCGGLPVGRHRLAGGEP